MRVPNRPQSTIHGSPVSITGGTDAVAAWQNPIRRIFANVFLQRLDAGEPVGRIATVLRVSVSYVSKVLTRRRLTGQTTARPQRCPVAPPLRARSPKLGG